MIKPTIFAVPFIIASMHASAGTLSAVTCSEYSISLTFASDIQDSGQDVTKAGIASSVSGPFTALSSSSIISVEGARNVTITLSDNDVIELGSITGGSSCTLQITSGFLSGVSSTSTASE